MSLAIHQQDTLGLRPCEKALKHFVQLVDVLGIEDETIAPHLLAEVHRLFAILRHGACSFFRVP
jgi:hypothetical protein